MKYWDRIVTISWISLTVVIVAAGRMLSFLPEFREYKENKETVAELEADIAVEEANYQTYHKKRERFKTDPSYVEQVAHEQGMVYPNETIYQIRN